MTLKDFMQSRMQSSMLTEIGNEARKNREQSELHQMYAPFVESAKKQIKSILDPQRTTDRRE